VVCRAKVAGTALPPLSPACSTLVANAQTPAGVAPTPAKTAVFDAAGNCSWHPCIVVDYDEKVNQYAMLMASTASEGGAPAPAPGAAPEWVPRINLCFDAEDPFVFAQRHAEAHAARLKAESLLRYHLYIDSMPL